MAQRQLLPFPFPLNVGTDICQISRIRRLLTPEWKAGRFIRRILAPEELRKLKKASTSRKYLQPILNHDPKVKEWSSEEQKAWKECCNQAAEFMAGRFAAKEAVIKAHPHLRPKLRFHDIIIRTSTQTHRPVSPGKLKWGAQGLENHEGREDGSGAPVAIILGGRMSGRPPHDQTALVSISHDTEYATAVCIGFVADTPPEDDNLDVDVDGNAAEEDNVDVDVDGNATDKKVSPE
ncbi:hypothetical protein B0H66DRAFT_559297 [Apodospora peruviana]|uniref:4'-phosphopantetheinyl transferase domain-containing protein n=1 Tax=Apodospora peruviana TaxID=516989 RepID=A0AAE0M5E8_9PEZI|nr:hypothetical protein B0H66DRAFT_559297 [Apodospora peruviana]